MITRQQILKLIADGWNTNTHGDIAKATDWAIRVMAKHQSAFFKAGMTRDEAVQEIMCEWLTAMAEQREPSTYVPSKSTRHTSKEINWDTDYMGSTRVYPVSSHPRRRVGLRSGRLSHADRLQNLKQQVDERYEGTLREQCAIAVGLNYQDTLAKWDDIKTQQRVANEMNSQKMSRVGQIITTWERNVCRSKQPSEAF